jgi:hypothetical protein
VLRAGRAGVRVPIRSLHVSSRSDPSGRTRPWPLLGLLTEMSNRKLLCGVERGRRERLITCPPSVSRLHRHCEILNISQRNRPPRPVTETDSLSSGDNWKESRRKQYRYIWDASGIYSEGLTKTAESSEDRRCSNQVFTMELPRDASIPLG